MTQEDKELLLKDLCARLPYGVIINATWSNYNINRRVVDIRYGLEGYIGVPDGMQCHIESIKPYLFPLSSMTEEQKKEFDISMDMGYAAAYNTEIKCANRMIDFFNKNHFDYRGLIEKGLAIDATGLNVY